MKIHHSLMGGTNMADHKKKMKNEGKKSQSDRVRKGIVMPVSRVSRDSLINFRDFHDLKDKYFVMKGRLGRKAFAARSILLMICQFIMTVVLLGRLYEALYIGDSTYIMLFCALLVIFNVPFLWTQLSLGVRRCHDLNHHGALFLIPFVCYYASFLTTNFGLDTAALAVQSITAVLYLALFSVRGTVGDNVYGREKTR
jgi:uncharacterized membrane protein YhaH (DUF805 family)